MNNAYTAVIKQDKDWWIGWIEEIPGVNCQEKTREQLLESLREKRCRKHWNLTKKKQFLQLEHSILKSLSHYEAKQIASPYAIAWM